MKANGGAEQCFVITDSCTPFQRIKEVSALPTLMMDQFELIHYHSEINEPVVGMFHQPYLFIPACLETLGNTDPTTFCYVVLVD